MRSMPFIMKNILLCCCLNLSILFGQFSYPAEDFLGGGIGYSPMYIKLDSLPGASYLTNLGLNPNNFDDPLVIHGGEGFAHVTGRWRIGGYAGMGRTSTSTIPEVMIFIDANSNGIWDEGELSKTYDEFVNPSRKFFDILKHFRGGARRVLASSDFSGISKLPDAPKKMSGTLRRLRPSNTCNNP